MTNRWFKSKHARIACVLAMLLLDAAPAFAWAVPTSTTKDPHMILTAGRRRKASTNSGAGRVHANGESYSQRDKRLARECKGRPNAGACLGYGQ